MSDALIAGEDLPRAGLNPEVPPSLHTNNATYGGVIGYSRLRGTRQARLTDSHHRLPELHRQERTMAPRDIPTGLAVQAAENFLKEII